VTPWDDYVAGSITYEQYVTILSIRREEREARSRRRLQIAETIVDVLTGVIGLAVFFVGFYTLFLARHV
jgi:hypothetical protein